MTAMAEIGQKDYIKIFLKIFIARTYAPWNKLIQHVTAHLLFSNLFITSFGNEWKKKYENCQKSRSRLILQQTEPIVPPPHSHNTTRTDLPNKVLPTYEQFNRTGLLFRDTSVFSAVLRLFSAISIGLMVIAVLPGLCVHVMFTILIFILCDSVVLTLLNSIFVWKFPFFCRVVSHFFTDCTWRWVLSIFSVVH